MEMYIQKIPVLPANKTGSDLDYGTIIWAYTIP